ncbi:hypothetical protein JKP88DRAFT_346480 [Tribonema minus]|uniref:Uncharacterized protein n=1 Tax=Tribonema minus TaxID=303371 RepID=A0A835Z5T4_9STRA|nr:hypothetical protein JKP88DRAFT_346480 [Tribonema minus]
MRGAAEEGRCGDILAERVPQAPSQRSAAAAGRSRCGRGAGRTARARATEQRSRGTGLLAEEQLYLEAEALRAELAEARHRCREMEEDLLEHDAAAIAARFDIYSCKRNKVRKVQCWFSPIIC